MKRLWIFLGLTMVIPLLGSYHSIYEIQYTTDPSGDSPYVGSTVTTSGVVTGVFSRGFFIEEKPAGAWKGIYAYQGDSWTPDVSRGDSVEVTGTIQEYYNMTEFAYGNTYSILASGVGVPLPLIVSTGDANDEQYESVLLKVENAQCTNTDLGHGEWEINDGSGPLRVDDWNVSYTPILGDSYTVIGPLNFAFDSFKVEPRDSSDIVNVSGIREINSGNVITFKVSSNFAPSNIEVSFILDKDTEGEIGIYDINGRLVKRVMKGRFERGAHKYNIDLKRTNAGIYFIILKTNDTTNVSRFIHL